MTASSRFHRQGQFGPSPTTEQKIDIFRECVLGWQIEVAEEMSRQYLAARAAGGRPGPRGECGFTVPALLPAAAGGVWPSAAGGVWDVQVHGP